MKKDMFIKRYKQLNVNDNCKKNLKKIKKFKFYLVELNKGSIIKKTFLANFTKKNNDY